MRILHALTGLFVAGSIRFDLAVCDLLKALGHEVVVAHGSGRPWVGRRPMSPKELMEYLPPFRRLNPGDFVDVGPMPTVYDHTRGEFRPPLPRAFLAWVEWADLLLLSTDNILVFRDFGKPCLYVVHWPTSIPPERPGPCICNSRYTLRAVRERWGSEWARGATVIHPPLVLEEYRPDRPFRGRDIKVVVYERLTEHKLRGLEAIRRLEPVVVGFRYPGALSGALEGMRAYYDLRWREIPPLLARCRAFTKLFRGEHWGLTQADAMASGVVPVVPREGGPWEMAGHGRYGLGYGDLAELAELLAWITGDGDAWAEWSARARRRAEEFSWEGALEALGNYLKTCL